MSVPFEPDPGTPDRRGIGEMKHLAGLYAMQDELHRRYPFLVREGCCGGGRRIDLETLSRFLWHQKSDSWCKTVSDQSDLCGANLFLPGFAFPKKHPGGSAKTHRQGECHYGGGTGAGGSGGGGGGGSTGICAPL